MGSGDPQTSKGCALGRVFTRQKEEEGHFQDRDVTQDTKTRGAKEGRGQGLRSQPMRLDSTGSEVGTYTRPPPPTKELFRAGRNTVAGGGGGESAGTKRKPTGGSMAPGSRRGRGGGGGLTQDPRG